ncbi:uncharacterized protein LOC122666106 [Telopea speciosissima]|uniref:uncharacterized protein LOC122666106 n=1 Tax=Telopea speciosissima TaxID=54955 RepID=UPI001CC6A74A|nr:uncharacterized protein LOC122666106 [Telopea speciosissima]
MVPPSSLLNPVFDLTTLSFIFVFLLFSLFSLVFIFYFRLKTRNSDHLREFSSLWTIRTLLVSFITLWALTETLRLPVLFFRRYPFIFSFFSPLTLIQQSNLCKIHVVLSLGLFEPGFFATLLFLVNVSVRKRNPTDTFATAFSIVSACCIPILVFQVLFVFFPTTFNHFGLPESLSRSFVLVSDGTGGNIALCTYPLFSSISFGAFGIVYVLSFLLSCWRLISLVINKGLRLRIYTLALAVLLTLPIQIVFLVISVLWNPDDTVFQGLALLVFLCMLSCAVVGVGILVIRPIFDALAVASIEASWCSRRNGHDLLPPSADVAEKPGVLG